MAEPAPPQDPFEMFRRLWGPLGVPVPGMTMPTLDPAEIEKRINELKSVETWLAMNLNVLRAAIQGLEMQKAGLSAMQQAMAAMTPPAARDTKPQEDRKSREGRKPQEGKKPQEDRKP